MNHLLAASPRTKRRGPMLTNLLTCVLAAVLPFHVACSGAGSDPEGRALPSDDQVVRDVTPPDHDNVVDVQVAPGGGEAYLHPSDLVWYFDRGVVVKRKANLTDAPDAILVVGGLARYQLFDDEYRFQRFLTTYNEYEGIAAPSGRALRAFVEANLEQVFIGREHNIVDVAEVDLDTKTPQVWHTPLSFTAVFRIRYTHRSSDTTLEERLDDFDVRFYRNTVEEPPGSLMATERSRIVVGTETRPASEIDAMKSLRTGFK